MNPRGNPTVPGAYVLTGLPLAGLSKWVGSLGMDYALPMGSGEWLFHGDWNLRSGYNSDTHQLHLHPHRWLWCGERERGLRVQQGWQVDVFARNLLNKDYITALTVQTGNSGLILGQPSDPRLGGSAHPREVLKTSRNS